MALCLNNIYIVSYDHKCACIFIDLFFEVASGATLDSAEYREICVF